MNMTNRFLALAALGDRNRPQLQYLCTRWRRWWRGNATANFTGNAIAGIDVDAAGVLRIKQFDARLAQQRFAAARAQGDRNVMRPQS